MSDPSGLSASTRTVPIFYSPSPSPGLDGPAGSPSSDPALHDHHLSFPASVHARASVAAQTDVGDFMLSNRDSGRGPPPPLPPKPPKLAVTSTGVGQAPPGQAHQPSGPFGVVGEWAGPSSGGSVGGGGLMAPQARNDRRPSEVLDLSMFAEQSPPQQFTTSPSSPNLSSLNPSQASTSTSGPFPARTPSPNPFPARSSSASAPFAKKAGPAIPPRPAATNPFPSFELRHSPSSSSSNLAGLGLATSEPNLHSAQSPPPDSSGPLSSEMSSMSLSSVGSSSILPPPPVHHGRDTSVNGSVRSGTSHSSSKLKDRFAAGVALGRSWASQAAESRHATKLQSLAVSSSMANIPTRSTPSPSSDSFPPPTPHGTEIKLPATILGVRVPKACGVVFGVDLEFAVASTHVPSDGLVRSTQERMDEVSGDEARTWLPAIAFRCLQYLEVWGRTEEGIFRVPGRSNLVAQLRALFDAGCDLDLREIHPADLEPHAVASLFKAWLRDIPESLLSPHLESTVDGLSEEFLGFTASAASFLAPQKPATAGAPSGLTDGRAPREYLEELRALFAVSMPAEHFVLLRALAYHLARVHSCAATTKMNLSNLRLILSPTLRMSPIFLQVLVEEREIIFSRANESSQQRRGSEAPSLVSPSMGLTSPRFGHTPPGSNPGSQPGSSRASPNLSYRKPPPTDYLTPTSPSHHDAEWLVVSSEDQYAAIPPALPPSVPVPHSPASSTGSRRTPIADRFASTFSSSTSDLHGGLDTPPDSARLSPSAASISSFASANDLVPPSKPYIPSRGAPNAVGGVFSKRDELPTRKGSAGSTASATLAPSSAHPPRSVTPQRSGSVSSTVSDRAQAGKSPVRRRNAVTSGGVLASFRQPLQNDANSVEQQEELAPEQATTNASSRGRQPSLSGSANGLRNLSVSPGASPSLSYLHRPSVDSTYSNASTVEEATISTGRHEQLSHEAPSLNLNLTLPTIGLGVGGEKRESEDDWGGLLSVSERKKLFSS